MRGTVLPVPRVRAILFDLGDTIMQETSEIKDADSTTMRADLFPGMAEALRALKGSGHQLGLVADTRPGTYRNVLGQHGLLELFDAFAISEELDTRKPDARMFLHALQALGVPQADFGRVMMVGNNLARDIRGANALGLLSVLIRWNTRYPGAPADPEEVPLHTVHSAEGLLRLVAEVEGTPTPA